MASKNGNTENPSRLDRMEALVEVLINRHIDLENSHAEFARERVNALIAVVDSIVRDKQQ